METEKEEGVVQDVDESDAEDQKVEEFFALIRRFQEARNRRKVEVQEEESKKKNKTRKLNGEQQPGWVPSFEWEDFTEEIQFRRLPVTFPRPCNHNKEEKKDEKDDGLDLKLTL